MSAISSGQRQQREPRDVARYVHRMARELRTMAHGAELGFLAYLLSLAEEEAATISRRLETEDK
jgi:hypothetical protein